MSFVRDYSQEAHQRFTGLTTATWRMCCCVACVWDHLFCAGEGVKGMHSKVEVGYFNNNTAVVPGRAILRSFQLQHVKAPCISLGKVLV